MLQTSILRQLSWAVTLTLAVLTTTGVQAQTSKDEIVRSLKPKGGLTRSLVTRKIEVIPGKEAEVLDKHKDLPKINLTIEFKYNSEQPTPAGERQLAVLAEALRDPKLNGFRYMLAGHTDARGSDDYNQRLSEKRALAVQHFLIQSAKLQPAKLSTVGFGKKRLLDSGNPDSARNRRVEVVNLGN
jgi:outer membrane protein OmpA-like peptidoglycan-associated protein